MNFFLNQRLKTIKNAIFKSKNKMRKKPKEDDE